MRYLALIYTPEPTAPPSDAETQQMMEEYGTYTEMIRQRGVYLGGEALHPSSTATTLRVRKGKLTATDGPFAESKEQLGGYYVLQCSDLDQAVEVAGKIPGARYGAIEVRPIMDMD